MKNSILQLAIMTAEKMCERVESGEIRNLDIMSDKVLSDCKETSAVIIWEFIYRLNVSIREDYPTRKEMGFVIKDEAMLIDEGKYYVVIRAEHAEDLCPEMTQAEAMYGPVLLKKQDPVLRTYLTRQENVFRKVMDNLRKAGRGPDDARYREITEEQEVLLEACRYYEDN